MTDLGLDHAFDLWDWTTVFGLVVVGTLVGYVLLPYAWPERRATGREYPSLMAGIIIATTFATFFAFLIPFRYVAGIDSAVTAKTIGTAFEGFTFAVAVGVGLHLRAPAHPSLTTLDDLAAQLADIQRMTAAATQSAELAHIAASAADDRVISQAERAVDDRERGIRIEGAIAENTELTQVAASAADQAYKEANAVNEKIANQGAALVAQGEAAVDDRERIVRIEDVSTDTNARAMDIQDRIKP